MHIDGNRILLSIGEGVARSRRWANNCTVMAIISLEDET